LGRDVLSRLFYGARISLIVAGLALVGGGGVGLLAGIVAGYLGGKVDAVLMRAVDIGLTFPAILFALVFAVTMGPGLITITLAISLTLWPRFARVIRGETLSISERDFVALAIVANCSPLHIMWRHIFPNVLNTFMVLLSLNVGYVIILEATLSFLGAGIQPPTPSWGQMVADGKEYIVNAWWVALIPGAALALFVLAFNIFGDWLRDTLDPRLRSVMG
jgi:peptide/nickel transport system permease protein